MNVLDRFRKQLSDINEKAFANPLPTHEEAMAQTTQQLRQWVGDSNRAMKDERGIAVAVEAYLESGTIPSYRDAKYLCFGAITPHAKTRQTIMENERLFTGLLSHVEGYSSQPKKFRRCYQGLFRGYLRYPGHRCDHPTGQHCWHLLRDFLHEYAKRIIQTRPKLDWTAALGQHLNLLREAPCAPYGAKLLHGDHAVLDELREKLGIDDDTWVMSELVLSQVAAATGIKDHDQFKSHIPKLTLLLGKHPLLISPGIAALLRRYAACDDRAENIQLRELALQAWKSPWLDANKALWHEHIGEDATDMVGLWLKQRSIRDFFELLQADGSADRERMNFWLDYAECIDEVWLALGMHSRSNRKPDYQRIRQEMDGRWMKLEGPNHNADNAFLMKINGHLVIEFARQNNACHVFDANRLPFKLGQPSVLATQEELKNSLHPGHRRKLMHKSGWQKEFADYLEQALGITLMKSSANSRRSRGSSASRLEKPAFRPPAMKSKPFDQEFELLKKICAKHGVIVADERDRTGEVFVKAGSGNPILETTLKSKGFTYLNDTLGWRKQWR